MIVTAAAPTAAMLAATGQRLRWRSLARRGMLHSECDAVDYLSLDPGTEFAPPRRDRSEAAWLVIAGTGQAAGVGDPAGADWLALHRTDLVLVGSGTDIVLRAGPGGLTLLWLDLMPAAVSTALPRRKPVV